MWHILACVDDNWQAIPEDQAQQFESGDKSWAMDGGWTVSASLLWWTPAHNKETSKTKTDMKDSDIRAPGDETYLVWSTTCDQWQKQAADNNLMSKKKKKNFNS